MRIYPPGTRKGNRYYVAKGSVGGKQYEFVCRDAEGRPATNARTARQAVRTFEREIRESGQPERPKAVKTWGEVADSYAEARGISANDQRYIKRLTGAWVKSENCYFGDLAIGDVLPLHVAEASNAAWPGCTNETKNRQGYTTAASVLHFAAENRLRDYVVIRKLPEKEPEIRRPDREAAKLLLKNTEADQWLLILVLFCQGWRITETLSLREDKINLPERTVDLWVNKTKVWQRLHLHDAVFEALANRLPLNRPNGRVFPWNDRHQVYDWLRPLCKKLGVAFTPHMARHEFGSLLRELGAHSRDIKDAGSWLSEKSTARYAQAPERAKDFLGKLEVAQNGRGKTRGRKASG